MGPDTQPRLNTSWQKNLKNKINKSSIMSPVTKRYTALAFREHIPKDKWVMLKKKLT